MVEWKHGEEDTKLMQKCQSEENRFGAGSNLGLEVKEINTNETIQT
tara:strand:+ start:380 stop:517 length:138 start_codon:yes stop_codon:yes gene_type:complete